LEDLEKASKLKMSRHQEGKVRLIPGFVEIEDTLRVTTTLNHIELLVVAIMSTNRVIMAEQKIVGSTTTSTF
jgi:hypothetical protein